MKKAVFTKGFSAALVLYAAVLLLGLSAWLWWLNGFLTDYEQSRPEYAAEALLRGLSGEYLDAAAAPTLEKLKLEITDAEQCKAILARELEQAECKKMTAGDSAEELRYAVLVGERQIGSFTLLSGGTSKHGFVTRVPGEIELDLMYLASETELTVPADWTVQLGGYTAGAADVRVYGIPYQKLGTLYDNDEGLALPDMTAYLIGPYLGEPELIVRDAEGNIRSERTEEAYAENCTPEEIEALISVTEPFIASFVDFSGNDNRFALSNYYRMAEYLDPESRLPEMFLTAVGSLSYAASRGDTLNGVDCKAFMKLREDLYFVDASYTVTTIGNRATITVEYGLYLVCRQTEQGLLVTAMYSH